jgi:hypothetical protein
MSLIYAVLATMPTTFAVAGYVLVSRHAGEDHYND